MKRTRLARAAAVFTVLALMLAVIGLPNIALADVDSVSITPSTDQHIVVGGTVNLTATASQSGTTTGLAYSWDAATPSNLSLSATTGASITVTGLVPSTTTAVTAHATDDVTTTPVDSTPVNIIVDPLSISSTSVTLLTGSTQQLTTNAVTTGQSWVSSSPGVATVSSTGLITAVSSGTTTITLTSDPGGGATPQTITCDVFVPSISLTPVTQSITSSSNTTLTLTVLYGGSLISSGDTITWANSNATAGTLAGTTSTLSTSGSSLVATMTFTSNTTGTDAATTITATVGSTGVSRTATVNVQNSKYLTIEGPSSLNSTTRTGLYTVYLHNADGTIDTTNSSSTVHWSWSSSYLSITSNTLNDYRADMHGGEAHIELYARYNTPSTGTRLYSWIDDGYDNRVYHTITITGLSSLPQTGQDFTLVYVFGGLGGALLIATGVWYGIRKKRSEKA